MSRISNVTSLWLLLVVLFTVGCKDDEELVAPSKSQLIAKNWQVQTLTLTLGTTPVPAYTRGGSQNVVGLDVFRLNFKPDGSYTQVEMDGTVSTNYSWKLINNETGFALIYNTNQVTVPWVLDGLTDQNLDFSRTIAANSTDPSDLYYLDLIKAAGLPTAGGVNLSLKAVPAK